MTAVASRKAGIPTAIDRPHPPVLFLLSPRIPFYPAALM